MRKSLTSTADHLLDKSRGIPMSGSLPHQLYTAEQVRQLDAEAIGGHGISGFELMKRAGQAAFDIAMKKWPGLARGGSIQVFCGAGNNAGDGYIIAALARQRYVSVRVVALKAPELLQGDARKAWEWYRGMGGHWEGWTDNLQVSGDLIVDALLGTGLSGPVEGHYAAAISKINASGKPVLSVDIPSGLSADTGEELGVAIQADTTVSFIGLKQGMFTGAGPRCCSALKGGIHFSSLRIPEKVYDAVQPSTLRLTEKQMQNLFKPRARDAHKGDFGHLLVVGGGLGMGGAALMAAETAMRCGAGRVTLATRPEHVTAGLVRCPELMTRGITDPKELMPLLVGKTAIVIGPGLGTDDWGKNLLSAVLTSDIPLLLDADALNLISSNREMFSARSNCVITPHPGEAARLLEKAGSDIQGDRFSAVEALQQLCGGTAILKGAGTLIRCSKTTGLCSEGNPGMAVAGMGDLLSGIIGALLAQGMSPEHAANLGVWLHARAGDDVVKDEGETGLAATDLIPVIRKVINGLNRPA